MRQIDDNEEEEEEKCELHGLYRDSEAKSPKLQQNSNTHPSLPILQWKKRPYPKAFKTTSHLCHL